jgi:hypothetical protein
MDEFIQIPADEALLRLRLGGDVYYGTCRSDSKLLMSVWMPSMFDVASGYIFYLKAA